MSVPEHHKDTLKAALSHPAALLRRRARNYAEEQAPMSALQSEYCDGFFAAANYLTGVEKQDGITFAALDDYHLSRALIAYHDVTTLCTGVGGMEADLVDPLIDAVRDLLGIPREGE